MIIKKLTIINKLGLHARAAAKFVSTANQFSSQISIGFKGEKVDGKSIMSVMLLSAVKGSIVDLCAEGPDAEEALQALTDLINNYFGEEE